MEEPHLAGLVNHVLAKCQNAAGDKRSVEPQVTDFGVPTATQQVVVKGDFYIAICKTRECRAIEIHDLVFHPVPLQLRAASRGVIHQGHRVAHLREVLFVAEHFFSINKHLKVRNASTWLHEGRHSQHANVGDAHCLRGGGSVC